MAKVAPLAAKVAKVSRGGQHAIPGRGIDRTPVGQRMGHGRGGDARGFGDILDGGAAG